MRHTTLPHAAIATMFLMTITPAAAPAADTRFGLDAEFAHDTNVNRAAYAGDEQSDEILSVEGHATRSYRLSNRSGIVVRGGLRLREHREFDDIGNIAALGLVAYRFQPTPGYTSPWVELGGTLEAMRFRDSELRDGYIASVFGSLGKHMTDRIRLGAGLGLDERSADECALYDLSTTRAWLTLDYRAAQKLTVYGSLTWLQGDQVFTAYYAGAQSQLIDYSDVIAADPAFASAFGGAAITAYRMEATTLMYDIGANIPVAGNRAIDFSISQFSSSADNGSGEYEGTLLRVSYLYRFQ